MKRTVFIGLLLLLALASCHSPFGTRSNASSDTVVSPEPQSPQRSQLLAIDSLAWLQPDSALALLLPWFDTVDSSQAFDNHYAQLLLAELLYKNDYAQTNRPALRQAVAYLDSLAGMCDADTRGASAQNATPTTVFLAARAHYINGVGYYENDSAVPACREYLKALEIMEEHFEEKEIVGEKARFMALTYTHLTGLFSDYYLHEQAIYFGKIALNYYKRYDAPSWHVSWMLNEIGSHYEMMKELDSADYYYRQAIHYLPDTTYRTYRDITARRAILLYDKEKSLEKALSIMYRLASMAMESKELLARYLFIGDIYYYEKQFDSAWVYLKYVFDNTQSFDSKLLAAERLREISMYNGDTIEAKEYALIRSQYATLKDEDGKLHSALSTLCQQHEHNRQETLHRQRIQKATRKWSIVLGLVVAVVAIVSFFLTLSRRHNKRLHEEKENVGRLLESERQTYRIQQAALSGRLKQRNKELRHVSKQLEQAVAKNPTDDESKRNNDYSAFINAPVCLQIVRIAHSQQFKSKMDYMAYKDHALSKEQLLALHDAAGKHLALFTAHIQKQFPNLTESDLVYCYFFLLGLSEADISAFLQRAYSTVCERSRKIKRTLEAKGSLYHTLKNMLYE